MTKMIYNKLSQYAKISEQDWEIFEKKIKLKKVSKGEKFIKEGEIPNKYGFILSGIFRVYYTNSKAEERILVFRGEGSPITAYSSILENSKSQINIEALEDSEVLVISLEDFNELKSQQKFWNDIIRGITQEIFIEKENREREFLSDDAETRYKNFIKKYSHISDRLNQYHIASYLGISNVSLSRIRKNI